MLDELGSPAVAIESDIRNLPESTQKKKKRNLPEYCSQKTVPRFLL